MWAVQSICVSESLMRAAVEVVVIVGLRGIHLPGEADYWMMLMRKGFRVCVSAGLCGVGISGKLSKAMVTRRREVCD